MTAEGMERFLRWIERFSGDFILSAPFLLDWEMISRVQQFNSAHAQQIGIKFGGLALILGNTGTGYVGKDAAGNTIPLALPSPIQILENYLASRSSGAGEALSIAISPASVMLGSAFTVTLSATKPGAGPFVLTDQFNTALLLPPIQIGINTVTASPSVFSLGTTTIGVKDQATGVSALPAASITFT